jgi:hypothetical protein
MAGLLKGLYLWENNVFMKYLAIPLFLLMVACGGDQDHADHAAHDAAVVVEPKALPGDPASQLLGAYYQLKSSLVEADSLAADSAALALAGLAKDIDVKELVADSSQVLLASTLLDSIADASSVLAKSEDLTARRRVFSQLGGHILSLLKHTDYGASTVYVQECPMAFNDTETASWLSDASEIVNPYLGKKHPKYSSGMLHCGDLKDSIMVKH